MSGIAQVYAAELNPTKPEIARAHGDIQEILGSYRLVDHRHGQVGIEALIGPDGTGALVQLPLSYRADEVAPEHTLTGLDHSVLGRRYVSGALADPVAVYEIIRTIVTGDDGADYSDGTTPYFDIRGSGTGDAEIAAVTIGETSPELVAGTVEVDGEPRSFELRMPRRPAELPDGDSAGRFHLAAADPADPARRVLLAELTLT